MNKKFYILLFLFFLPAQALFAQQDSATSFRDIKQAKALRELVMDESLRRLAKENAQARRKQRQQLALKRLEAEEVQHRRSSKTEKSRFFFTPQSQTALTV